ncbi:hypothetical protein XENTR_v10002840 [Xenopus tropicalis]|nr:hypothetical protein XENTR_v10002840 [Xenopus tropicalis]
MAISIHWAYGLYMCSPHVLLLPDTVAPGRRERKGNTVKYSSNISDTWNCISTLHTDISVTARNTPRADGTRSRVPNAHPHEYVQSHHFTAHALSARPLTFFR